MLTGHLTVDDSVVLCEYDIAAAAAAAAAVLSFNDDLYSPVHSGVTRLQWARVQVFQKGPLFPKKTF